MTLCVIATHDPELRGAWYGTGLQGIRSRRLPDEVQRAAQRKLELLDAAETIGDLREPPSNRLEMLKGDRKGFWSIRINKKWRVIFRWVDGYAEDVEIIDYH